MSDSNSTRIFGETPALFRLRTRFKSSADWSAIVADNHVNQLVAVEGIEHRTLLVHSLREISILAKLTPPKRA